MDIHNYKKRYARTLQRVRESNEITDDNKEIILKFNDYLLSEGIGSAKIERYLGDVMKLNKMLSKPFPDATEADLRRVVGELNQTTLSEETKKTFKIMLRRFYKFIHGVTKKGTYPPEVEWISIAIPHNHTKLPEELLTEQEIIKIIRNCKTIRDKALVATLAESGCRVSEIGNMQIKHVSFEEYGARLTVNGKTGMRKILVINSAPYLQEWVNQHPFNEEPEYSLWAGRNTKSLCYTRIVAVLKESAKRAGIKKRVYLHLLRHSRATLLANKMSDSALKHYLGWSQSSKMAGIYIHMSGKETDETILELNGIKVEKEHKASLMKPKKCLRCKSVNGATNKFCKLCGLPLAQEEAEKILKADVDRSQADNIMNKLVQDPEIMELIKKKLSAS